MVYCHKCGNPTILMSGVIDLTIDDEPYESGKYEESKTDVNSVEKPINAYYCEYCDEIISTFN